MCFGTVIFLLEDSLIRSTASLLIPGRRTKRVQRDKKIKTGMRIMLYLMQFSSSFPYAISAQKSKHKSHKLYSLFYPITLEGRRSTTDEIATIPFHLVLFSAALVELAKSIPAHSLILSSNLFFCLPLLFFFLSLCPVGLSLLNQKTLRHGQTILAFVS